jgi:hypothetical protein
MKYLSYVTGLAETFSLYLINLIRYKPIIKIMHRWITMKITEFYENVTYSVGFEVLTAVTMNSAVI